MDDNEQKGMSAKFTEILLNSVPQLALDFSQSLLDNGMDPLAFFQQVYTPALKLIGEQFGRLEIFLPELVSAADTAKMVADQVILPMLPKDAKNPLMNRGKVVIATVNGDLHNIGKNMVAMMLSVNGFDVVDAGVNVPSKTLIQRALDEHANILALSALMTTSMQYMKEVIEMRNGFGYQDMFAIIVGGAPVSESFARDLGADAYGDNAVEAVNQCNSLMAKIKA